jgi:hypothetical protein
VQQQVHVLGGVGRYKDTHHSKSGLRRQKARVNAVDLEGDPIASQASLAQQLLVVWPLLAIERRRDEPCLIDVRFGNPAFSVTRAWTMCSR